VALYIDEFKERENNVRSIKIMLLGISIILVSMYIPQEVIYNTAGFEIFTIIFGFILILIGFFKKDN